MAVPPTCTLADPVLLIARLATSSILSVSVTELLPGVESMRPGGTAIEATLDTEPLVAVTLAATVI